METNIVQLKRTCICTWNFSISVLGRKLVVIYLKLLPNTCEDIEARRSKGQISKSYRSIEKDLKVVSIYSNYSKYILKTLNVFSSKV